MKKIFLVLFLFCSVSYVASAQCGGGTILTVTNPSFEGTPAAHVTPPNWDICMPGVTPDTQPGFWGQSLAPSNGSSYIGLVYAPSISWQEGAGQTLSSPMVAGTTYNFTIDLAVPASADPATGIVVPPYCSVLQLWGGMSGVNSGCDQAELLWTSPVVSNSTWQTYSLTFTPTQNWNHILFLIATTNPPCTDGQYLMMDNMSTIVPQADVAEFAWTSSGPTTDICDGNIVNFHDSSTSVDGTILSWAWNFGDGTNSTAQNPSHTFSGPGTYNVSLTIISSVPCTTNVVHQVIVYDVPTVTVSGGGSICDDGSTTIPVVFTFTGTPPWNMTYTNGTTPVTVNNINSSPYTLNVSVTGTFSVTSISNGHCTGTSSGSANVIISPEPAVTNMATTICSGGNFSLTPVNGTNGVVPAGTTYTWAAPGIAGITGAAAGSNAANISGTLFNTTASPINVVYTVTPAAGTCTGTPFSVTVTVNPPITVVVPADITVCPGIIVDIATFSSPTAGAAFAWTNSNTAIGLAAASGTGNLPSFTATNNGASSIVSTITVTPSANSCNGTPSSYTITVNPQPVIIFSPMPQLCITSPLLSLSQASPAGGTYSGPGVSGAFFNPSVAGAGTHTITYVYIDPVTTCTDTATQTIVVIESIPVGVSPTSIDICPGSSAPIVAFGANTYDWTPLNGLDQYSGPSVVASPEISTVYTVVGTNNIGCTGSNSVNVNIYNTSVVEIAASPPVGCEPLHVTMSFQPESLVEDSTWFWHFGDYGSAGNISHDKNPEHIFASEGDYVVTFTALDINGCSITDTTMIHVYVVPNADFYNNPDVGYAGITDMDFIDVSTDANFWLWDFGDPGSHNNNSSDLQNPSHMYADSGTYTVQLIVTSSWECSDTAIKQVVIYPEAIIYIPNAFTPNEDSRNDFFGPVITGIDRSTYKFLIYDRWGRQIFYSEDINTGWDGKDKNKFATPGIYVYLVYFSEYTGKEHKVKGYVTLVR